MTKPKGLQCVHHVILEHQTRLLITLFICLQPGHQGEPGIGVVSQPRQGKSLHTNNAILFFLLFYHLHFTRIYLYFSGCRGGDSCMHLSSDALSPFTSNCSFKRSHYCRLLRVQNGNITRSLFTFLFQFYFQPSYFHIIARKGKFLWPEGKSLHQHLTN